MEFGEYLKQLRESKGIPFEEFRKKMESGGIHDWSLIEKIRFAPDLWVLRRIAVALDVTIIGLMIKAGYVTEEEVLTYRSERGVSP